MTIIDIKSKDSLQNATTILKKGGVLVFPTDTVYGIGCLLDEESIEKLYKIKSRPSSQPTAVLMNRNVFDGKRNSELVFDWDLDQKFFSGEMTIIDNCANYTINFPKMITNQGTIGVRLPQHKWLEKLIDEVGPIVTSSANKKGEPAPTNFQEISDEIKAQADLVIESKEKISGKPSEIYDLALNKKIR